MRITKVEFNVSSTWTWTAVCNRQGSVISRCSVIVWLWDEVYKAREDFLSGYISNQSAVVYLNTVHWLVGNKLWTKIPPLFPTLIYPNSQLLNPWNRCLIHAKCKNMPKRLEATFKLDRPYKSRRKNNYRKLEFRVIAAMYITFRNLEFLNSFISTDNKFLLSNLNNVWYLITVWSIWWGGIEECGIKRSS